MLIQDSREQKATMFALLDTVLKNGMAPFDAARQSWLEGNADHAARQLHTVRGTLGSFGLRRFAVASLAAEQALRLRRANAGDEDGVASLLNAAARALQDGLDDMRTWLAMQRLSLP